MVFYDLLNLLGRQGGTVLPLPDRSGMSLSGLNLTMLTGGSCSFKMGLSTCEVCECKTWYTGIASLGVNITLWYVYIPPNLSLPVEFHDLSKVRSGH